MFGVGAEPPPESSEPRSYAAMSPGVVTASRSAWVIWPAFSARDIRDRRSATRFFTGSPLFRYGSPWASTTTCGVSVGGLAPVTVSLSGIVSAASAGLSLRVRTRTVREVPEAVPAGNVNSSLSGV